MDAGSALRALLRRPSNEQHVVGAPSPNWQVASVLSSPAASPSRLGAGLGEDVDELSLEVDLSLSESDVSPVRRPQRASTSSSGAALRDVRMSPERKTLGFFTQERGTGPSHEVGVVVQTVAPSAGVSSSASAPPASALSSQAAAAELSVLPASVEVDMPPPFAWLRGLPRELRQRLTSCQSPHEARALLAEALAAEAASRVPEAPQGLAEDLRRHAQTAQWRAMDIEEMLQQQASAHEAEFVALRADHKQRCRHAKLQLLAKWAPHSSGAAEANYACHADPSPFLAIGAALSKDPANGYAVHGGIHNDLSSPLTSGREQQSRYRES